MRKGTTLGEAPVQIRKEADKAVEGKTPMLLEAQNYFLSSLKIGVAVIGSDGTIKQHNRAIVRLLELVDGNLEGQNIEDAGLLARLPELASYVDKSHAGPGQFRARVGTGVEDRLVEITLKPIVDDAGQQIGMLLQCEDATLQEQLENTVQALHSTRSDLESANEELQVTNEELEATNDELQSTNEELATTNEELQSLNEELQITNLELADRTKEVDELNQAYARTLERIGLPVLMVNQNGRIDFYNRTAARLFKLKSGQQVLQMEKLRLPASLQKLLMQSCGEVLYKGRHMVLSKVALRGHPNGVDIHFNLVAQEDRTASVLITFEPHIPQSGEPKRRRAKLTKKKT